MGKYLRRTGAIILVLMMTVLLACCSGYRPMPGPSFPPGTLYRTNYDIQVKYDEASHTAECKQTVVYINNAKDQMNEVYLHIYPNHFSKKEYVSMLTQDTYQTYPGDVFSPGSIAMDSVMVNGTAADFKTQGEENTVLRIGLKEPLMRGHSIQLSLGYRLQLPNMKGRFSWSSLSTNFANWYPIMAVYDDKGWHLDKYYELGDPFYSETSDYHVTIDLPQGMQAATTGKITSDVKENGRHILDVKAECVRDFAFVASNAFTICEKDVQGVNLRVALPSKDAKRMSAMQAVATDALRVFNKRFGAYIGDTLTVAFVNDFTGMEYPGIVFIDADLLNGADNADFCSRCVVHEIAHQWWYSAVGNNEVDEAWLDESLTSFSEMVFVAEKTGWEEAEKYWDMESPAESKPLLRKLGEFYGWSDYGYIYRYGPLFYRQLMKYLGDDAFYAMLQKYYSIYKFRVATSDGLRNLVVETGNTDAIRWYDKWVYGK